MKDYPGVQTITQTIIVNFIPVCKATIITSTQTLTDMEYIIGKTALIRSFDAFVDSVSIDYNQ